MPKCRNATPAQLVGLCALFQQQSHRVALSLLYREHQGHEPGNRVGAIDGKHTNLTVSQTCLVSGVAVGAMHVSDRALLSQTRRQKAYLAQPMPETPSH